MPGFSCDCVGTLGDDDCSVFGVWAGLDLRSMLIAEASVVRPERSAALGLQFPYRIGRSRGPCQGGHSCDSHVWLGKLIVLCTGLLTVARFKSPTREHSAETILTISPVEPKL